VQGGRSGGAATNGLAKAGKTRELTLKENHLCSSLLFTVSFSGCESFSETHDMLERKRAYVCITAREKWTGAFGSCSKPLQNFTRCVGGTEGRDVTRPEGEMKCYIHATPASLYY
jgi:hypothetical protein